MTKPVEVTEGLREYATPHQRKLVDAVLLHGSVTAAATALGVDVANACKSIHLLKANAAKSGYSPEHDMTSTVPDGFRLKGTSTLYTTDKMTGERKVSVQWVKSQVDLERQAEIMAAAADALALDMPRLEPVDRPAVTATPLANLYTFTDYHLGMMAWAPEGGADWDLKIAERTLLGAFEEMMLRAPRARVAVINIQGDFLHQDSLEAVTPTHRHPLDAAGRFPQIVDVAMRAIRRMVDIALMRHEEVHLVIAEGNHDIVSSMWLKKMFAALYEREPRLSVNESEIPYYAFQHGQVMLAFHHGHMLKPEQLPLLMAAQFAPMWGLTSHRYAHCGHRHHKQVKEHAGMTVTQHQTLSARDAHASRGGWHADRAATCETYHSTFGKVGETTVVPEMMLAA